jgi:hypothetical protein
LLCDHPYHPDHQISTTPALSERCDSNGCPLWLKFLVLRSPDHPITGSPDLLRVGFPIPAMSRDPGDSGDSCGPLPVTLSHRPTPHKRFVENKSQTPTRPSGRPNGRSLFSRFSGLQSGSISALFSRFCCPVGRGSQRAGASVLADG